MGRFWVVGTVVFGARIINADILGLDAWQIKMVEDGLKYGSGSPKGERAKMHAENPVTRDRSSIFSTSPPTSKSSRPFTHGAAIGKAGPCLSVRRRPAAADEVPAPTLPVRWGLDDTGTNGGSVMALHMDTLSIKRIAAATALSEDLLYKEYREATSAGLDRKTALLFIAGLARGIAYERSLHPTGPVIVNNVTALRGEVACVHS